LDGMTGGRIGHRPRNFVAFAKRPEDVAVDQTPPPFAFRDKTGGPDAESCKDGASQ
jgi:hypothetical protein